MEKNNKDSYQKGILNCMWLFFHFIQDSNM